MITSGVAPAIVMVQLLNESFFGNTLNIAETFSADGWNLGMTNYLPLIGLVIAMASGYRLAKFNVDTRQTTSFIGLPTPANALLILSLPLILHFQSSDWIEEIILNKWFLIGLTLVSSMLLNAELPLFGLKFKTWDFKSNAIRYLFLVFCAVLLVLLKFIAIPLIIVLYILLSVFWKEN
jgi:CDP-diacylglycerol--serine O-phosphatidyltransferase